MIRHSFAACCTSCRAIASTVRAILFVGPLTLFVGAEQCPAAERPNIVYILADDLGYGDVTCYNADSKIPTPHVDRLAREGMRFTDAHTPSAVCTPTRYGILTGRYAWRTKMKFRVLDGLDPPLIEEDRLTVPALLKQHGYDTGCVGKWHLGMQWTDRAGNPVPYIPVEEKGRPRAGADVDYTRPVTGGPTARGFDWYFGISASLNMSPFCYIEDDRPVRLPVLHQSRIQTDFISVDEGVRSPDFTIYGVMPRLAGEAVGFIERHVEESPDRPFFLYAPLTAPHLPLVPNEEYRGVSKAGHYGDFVAETDAFVGAVLEALDRTKQADNTLVIFTSDNGGLYHYWEPVEADDRTFYRGSKRGRYVQEFGHQGNAHLRGTKADIWEGGHRVPFVVRWPGKTPAGRVSNELIELTDLLATCAALLEVELPAGAGPDSRNALPALLNVQPDARVRDYAVHHSLWGAFAIRSGPWKLIAHRGSGGFTFPRDIDVEKTGGPPGQLYNLETDPSETKNVWIRNPEVVSRLSALLAHVQSSEEPADAASKASAKEGDVFLLPYFLGNGETGIHFAWSRDGLKFEWLNDGKVVMPAPPWGDESLTRDPSIVYHDGQFHMVWTTSWNSRSIGYSHSRNLTEWSKPRKIDIWGDFKGVRNTWAPELHWDPERKEFLILWSSTTLTELNDGDGSEDQHGYDHRSYASRTKDFRTFTKPKLFFAPQPEYSVIDPYLAHDDRGTADTRDDRWVMVIKHELSEADDGKNLRLTFSHEMQGPYGTTLGPPIVGAGTSIVNRMGEGPSLFKRNGEWFLYWDAPGSEYSYCLATSHDLKTWKNRSAEMSLPAKQMRHGTVLVVPSGVVPGTH